MLFLRNNKHPALGLLRIFNDTSTIHQRHFNHIYG